MSADQTNDPAVTRFPNGSYGGVTSDTTILYSVAMRSMEETGAESVTIHLSGHGPNVDNPTIFTYEMDRSGALRFVSSRPGVLPANSNN
ncbi:uncharacterized protein FSUBG_13427 [Fusarium subglutinans]|uniref:Uncharacterized protein n=1 Tax=Gibberella subglutinans TaxID=42677 RepID=A0A8H5KTH8_GIBSU|nr:uncharacterized protein FSUBG_13427 [Fusarium subglutinans]KAF5580274.1 hypothetical protein FSUBG_13427 [Fusarium subglutinans]